MNDITGAGGGGKAGGGSARTPQESPDSLRNTSFAVVMDIISNGEISGFADPSFPLKNVFLDGTPVQNNDGSLNFQNVRLDFRPGTSSQAIIPSFQNSANIINDGREIKQSAAWVQAISNPSLTAVRLNIRLPQLVKTVDSGDQIGDRVGSAVTLAFDIATNGGAYAQVLTDTISGKTISGYTRTYRLNLPAGTSWSIRVRRITADSTSDTLLNKTFMQSYVEVTDGKFVYPMTAYSVMSIDAEQFQSIPARGYRIKGRIIQVPVNYDPVTRIYTGVWNGTFKLAYSNNPAWIYYDILVNKLYGLGDRVNAAMVDRYAVYQIGAYCDQMVPNGQGGTEPRFVCNAYIQGQQDALRVLNDLSSVFRGMVYYAGGQIVPVADSPSDPVYTYTNANVVDGRVTYTGADVSTIKTVALVSYNDPTDFYRSKVEVVEDRDGISRYGVKKLEVTAFGCTSRGQAQRVGLYHLYTSYMETGGAAFSVGLDGVVPQPGRLIKLADRNRAGRRIGGRIKSATTTQITLDYDHQIVSGNSLTVTLATGAIQSRNVTGVSGRVITVSPAYSSAPKPESSWAVDSTSLVTQTLRVVSVRERDGINYDISAIFSHPGKWAAIDSNVRLDPLPVSIIPARSQAAPTNVVISQYHTFHQGTTRHNAEIRWDSAEGAIAYDVQWRRDNSDWIPMIRSGERLRELTDIHAGSYLVRVRAVNGLDVPSLWAYSVATTLDGLAVAPPVLSSITATGEVMAIRLDWVYPNTPNIISFVEIRASLTNAFGSSYVLTRAAYPDTSYTLYGLGYGTEMWFWARLIDKNGMAGAWFPASSGAGRYGKSSTDSNAILAYLEGKIGASQLTPELIAQIEEGTAEGVLDMILGDLSGDDVLDAKWFAGDSADHYVGTVTTTSAYNDGDFLEAMRTVSLAARMDDSIAVIREEQRVMASETEALAIQIITLAASIGDMESVVQQTSQAVVSLEDGLLASWQVKTQVRSDGRVVQAGVALGASIDPLGVSRSEFLVMADTVAFLNTINGQLHVPFVFDVVNDTFILNNAIIGNASIGSAKLANWIESDAVGPGGLPVLRLNFRTGEIQINPSLSGSGRLSITNQLVSVYDGSNNLRVRMGIW